MTTELPQKHKEFADRIWKRHEEVRKAKARKSRKTFKAIPNTAKISVTQTAIYTDSYLASVPSALERLCRVSASSLIMLLNEHAPGNKGYKTHIKIHGHDVKVNTPAVRDLLRVLRHQKCNHMKCVSCGVVAKYAYIERIISNHNVTHYNIAFYGVKADGTEHRMTVDHIDAKSMGGSHDNVENMQVMCSFCNALKSSIPNELFMESRELVNQLVAKQGNK